MNLKLVMFLMLILVFILLSSILLSKIKKTTNPLVGFMLLITAYLVAFLAFHFVPQHFLIFPKDQLSFSKTVLMQDDIDEVKEHFIGGGFNNKWVLDNTSLVRVLLEHGLLTDKRP